MPGICAYTAAAIAAIAFDRPATVVDGNVERVMARLHAVEAPLPEAKPLLTGLAARLTPMARSGDYAQAVMDLGATICTPRAPACGLCPWRADCAARRAGIDLRTTWLPDQLTYPLLWIGLALSTITLFVGPPSAIYGALAGYLSLWSVYWAFKLLTGKEGMGHGDFKLLAALGAWCGAGAILPIVLISSLVGAVVGSLWLGLRGADRATPIPFGPYLAIAGWIQFMWGPQLLQLYLRLSGLG